VGVTDRFPRYSRHITRGPRWQSLRIQALRRDGFKCVQCGAHGRLEIDHIEAVRNAPDKAHDLANLQTLCAACHARKTRIEAGLPEISPARKAWRDLLSQPLGAKPSSNGDTDA
jgi:5-methylcytosine-specific restriction endonuclease McrA